MEKEPKRKTVSNNTKKTSTSNKKTTTKSKNTATKKPKNEQVNKEVKTIKKPKEQVNKEIKNETKKIVNDNKLDYKIILISVLALLIIIITILKINGTFLNKDYSQSYLLKNKIITNKITDNISDIKLNKDSFVFITSLKNEKEYNLEKELKKVITKNKIQNNFYIYIYDNENINLNNIFQISEEIKFPTILYYKNGEFIDMVKRNDENMMEAADFVKLLDIYELSKEE